MIHTDNRGMFRRVLCVLLAAAICLTLFPVRSLTAAAEDTYDFRISSADELIELLGNGNTANLDKSFLLTADIKLSGSWTPVSTFTGTFDGGGHTISGMYTYCGGFFGVIGVGGTVRNLCVDGEFDSWYNNAGGIAGVNSGLIENCINKGFCVRSYASHVGGIVARNEETGIIRNCYNIGDVRNDGAATAGIAARNAGTIENCFNTGSISSGCGVVHDLSGNGEETNCYYSEDGGKTFKSYDDPEDVITPAELAERLGDSGIVTPDGDLALKPYSFKGSGTQSDPYLIYTADELRMITPNGGLLDKYYRLEADIDLKGSESDQWTPIGDSRTSFKGVFDGNGHKISGLYIYAQGIDQGLFGYIDGGTIKDLAVDGSVAGTDSIGGIAGRLFTGTISNCTYTGTITYASYGYDDPFMDIHHAMNFGGIVGNNYSGKVENCRNFAEVSGCNYVGGICGYINDYAQMINCSNEGKVSGNSNVGGVVGESCGTVRNCYNIGKVTGTSINDHGYIMKSRNIGGVAGSGRNGIIEYCYNIGTLDGDQNIGGIAGYLETFGSTGRIKNSYFLDTTAEQGVGESPENGETFAMSATAFKSGEVAYILQEDQDEQVWYQDLTNDPRDAYPVLTGDESTTVIEFTFVDPTAYGNPGGSAVVKDGSVITPPGSDLEFTVGENGDDTTVDSDGNVTVPKGGSVQIGDDITVTAPKGGTIEIEDDDTLILPGESVVTKDGESTTVPKDGAKYDPETEEMTPLPPKSEGAGGSSWGGTSTGSGSSTDKKPGDKDKPASSSSAVTAEGLPENVTMTVNEVSENSAIVEFIKNNSEWTLAKCYNVELFEDEVQIYKLDSAVKLRFEIPKEFSAEAREFAVIRLHGSSLELLYDIDTDPDTATVETDRFSIYALVYKTEDVPAPGVSDGTGNSSGNPGTGDPVSNLSAVVLAGAVSTAAVTVKKRKIK